MNNYFDDDEWVKEYVQEDSHHNISINTHPTFPEHPKYFDENDPFPNIQLTTSTTPVSTSQSPINKTTINTDWKHNETPNKPQIEPSSLPTSTLSPNTLQINLSQEADNNNQFSAEGTPNQAMNNVSVPIISPNAQDPVIPSPTFPQKPVTPNIVHDETPKYNQASKSAIIIDECEEEEKHQLVSPSKPQFVKLKDGSNPATGRASTCKYKFADQMTRDRAYTKWMDVSIDLESQWTIFGQLGLYLIISCILKLTLPPCHTWQIVIRSGYWGIVGLVNFIWLLCKFRAKKYDVCMVVAHILKLMFQIICVSPLPFTCLPFMDEVLLDIIILIAVGFILLIYALIRFLRH